MSLPIHKEGRKTIYLLVTLLVFVNIILFIFVKSTPFLNLLVLLVSLIILVFTARFFRTVNRNTSYQEGKVYSGADGKIVAIEEVNETEYFGDQRIQVSVFMSVWNIHINWFPVSGTVRYTKYHPGKYLVARHPKSSLLNERTTTVIQTREYGEIMIRQIAGFVARRVVCYSATGNKYPAGKELGFIKFGSRVDIFLPVDSEIQVSPGDKVKGALDVIALLKTI